MMIVTKDRNRIIDLDMADIKGKTLLSFYIYVAECLGYKDEEIDSYDCTKICIAGNIQDAIIKSYQRKFLGEYMQRPALVDQEIFHILAVGGPKRDYHLSDNQVKVEEGFIVWKTAQ